MCGAKRHVCFTPNSDRESEIPQKAMSALPPKADMCGATRDVRFGPKADIIEIVSGPIYISAMSPSTRYWTLHWLRVLLWPAPVLSLFRAGRWAMSAIRRR